MDSPPQVACLPWPQLVRVKRSGAVVWEGPMVDLRRFKENVDKVDEGMDCGVLLDGFQGEEMRLCTKSWSGMGAWRSE